ncbi:MAG TPA: twin-arginine translocase subunit TatC [Bacilli bacterium]
MREDREMSLVDHLSELRSRIVWVLVVLVAAMIGGLFAAERILEFLKEAALAKDVSWNVFSPWDAIRVYMQIAFVIALSAAMPIALIQMWSFVKPGLRMPERKAALKYIPWAILLFFGGLAFGYRVVFPMAFQFTLAVTHGLGLTETYGITQYFSFMFNIIIPLSLLFELPVLVMFLTRIRVLNPMRLQKMRRYAYMLLIVIATMVTPPDIISDLLVTIPLILLFELSVILSRIVYRKQLAEEQSWIT